MRISRAWAIAVLVLIHLAWSGHLLAGRLLVRDIPPLTLSFLRWLIATPFLFLWARNSPGAAPTSRAWPLGIALALTGTYGFTAVLYASLHEVTAAESGLIYGATPALLSLLSLLVLKERPGALGGLGIALSVLGVFVIVGAPLRLPAAGLGDLYALLASLSWAVYTVLGRWAMGRWKLSPVYATYVASLYSLPLGLVGSLWELYNSRTIIITFDDLLLLLYASLVAACLAFAGWYIAVEAIGPNAAAPFSNLIPLFAPLLSFFLLGEGVELREIAGGALIVAGAALASLSPLPASSSRPRPASG